MATKKENSTPNINDNARQSFLDELEGRVEVAEEKSGKKQPVKVQDEPEEEVAKLDDVVPPAPPELDEVFKDDGKKAKKEMAKFDRAPRRRPWIFIVIGLVVLAATTVAGFWFFSRGQKFSGKNVGLEMTLPDEIVSGEEVTLTVRYHNDENVDLRNVQIALEYPEGFTVTSVSKNADNDFKNAFTIGDLKSNQIGELTVSGQIVGAVDTKVSFSGTMSYRPETFNSDFQAEASVEGTISSSTISLVLDGPTKISPTASGTWTISYENTSTEELKNIEIEVQYPQNFVFQKGVPTPTEEKNVWRVNSLAAGAKGKITITGSVSGKAGDTAEFIATAGLVKSGSEVTKQAQTNLLTTLVSTGVTVSIAANGETGASNINPGDSVTYTIKLENNSEAEVNDVTVKANLTGTVYNLAGMQDFGQGKLSGSVITWTKAENSGLQQIVPKGSVTLAITVPTFEPAAAKKESEYNPSGTLAVTVSSPDISATDTKTATMVTKVATTLKVTAEGRYYDDEGLALGSGPVPPKVGQTTSYRIYWTATSTTNDVSSFTASAVLPSSVLWTGKNVSRDAGDIVFDAATRTVTWTINKVPAGTGSRYPSLKASFEVSITPTADQVGSVVILSEILKADGTDASTGQKISATANSLDSSVPNDPQAGGEGIVGQ